MGKSIGKNPSIGRLKFGRSSRAFFGGMSSCLDVLGDGDFSPQLRIYVSGSNGERIDALKIASDWEFVASDIQYSIKSFDEQTRVAGPRRTAVPKTTEADHGELEFAGRRLRA